MLVNVHRTGCACWLMYTGQVVLAGFVHRTGCACRFCTQDRLCLLGNVHMTGCACWLMLSGQVVLAG